MKEVSTLYPGQELLGVSEHFVGDDFRIDLEGTIFNGSANSLHLASVKITLVSVGLLQSARGRRERDRHTGG